MIEMKIKAAVSSYNEILLACGKVGIQIDMIKLRVQKWIFTFMVSWFLIRIPRQLGFPGGTSGKEPACQCRRRKRRGFHSWVGKMPWRRARQPTPVSLPGESHGERSLAGYSPWGHEESHTTEVTVCTRASAHRPNGRKRRGSKEPPDEGKRRESKSWLKTQHSKNWDHGIWSHHFMANRWGKSGNSGIFYFLGFPNHCGWWLQPWN